jgi:hypothetical protein
VKLFEFSFANYSGNMSWNQGQKSDCIFLDGNGMQYTTSEYYIELKDNKYILYKEENVDVLEPYNYFQSNGYIFY